MSSHPVDVHVGKRLRLRRTILGMSQESLGNAIGVTFQQIQKYERGINRIGSSKLFEFARALDVPVSYFFEEFALDQNNDNAKASKYVGMAESSGANNFEYEQLTSRETLEMVRNYYRIKDPEVRKRVFDLIKTLCDDVGKSGAA